ncbi:MAG: hypothetical protein R2838_00720 [Caldilineaceae bacterium]
MQAYLADVPRARTPRRAPVRRGRVHGPESGRSAGIFHDYLQRAFNGEMPVDEAMAAAQAAADEALEPFR